MDSAALTHPKKSAPTPARFPILGVCLLATWLIWWAISWTEGRLRAGRSTWIPPWEFLGADFLHNYGGVHAWLHGIDPYGGQMQNVPFGPIYGYPPVALVLFAWTGLFTPPQAVFIWLSVIALGCALGTIAAMRLRQHLRLSHIPTLLACGLVLLSTPVLFAMERGQYDVLVVFLILLTVLALRHRSAWSFVAAGICVALAGWVKIYPLALLPGLVALRAYKALMVAVVAFVMIGVIPWHTTRHWMETQNTAQGDRVRIIQSVSDWLHGIPPDGNVQYNRYPPVDRISHSISHVWLHVWYISNVLPLARVPGLVGASVLLFPPAIWLCWRVFRCPDRAELAYPLMLWLVTLATFWMPISYDYNLLFLPLLVMAVWDRRDPLFVQLMLAPMIVWWQPFGFRTDPYVLLSFILLVIKIMAMVAMTWCLDRRVRELDSNRRHVVRPARELVRNGSASPPSLSPS